MSRRAVLTIISENYMPFAEVLVNSLITHDTESDIFIFVVDEDVSRGLTDRVNILCWDKVEIRNYKQRAMYFDITEFNTSVKPDVIKYLINQGYSSVIYLDPDIKVFDGLDSIFDKLESGNFDFVITPHITSPIKDVSFPSEVDILKTGIYNLGFIGVASTGIEIIEWWSERLESLGFNDTANGLFTDQKWIDLLPGFTDRVYIDRNRGLNVAYWNLHERILHEKGQKHFVDDQSLVFFHFSGIDINNIETISRYQNRHSLRGRLDLAKLSSEYADEVMTNLKEKPVTKIYKYGMLFSNYPISNMTRKLYKRFIEINPKKLHDDPFLDNSSTSFIVWLVKNNLVEREIKTNVWENNKVLYKADNLLKNEYKLQFSVISFVFRMIRRILGDKGYSNLMRVLFIISNTRRGAIIYDNKIKVE